MVGNNRRVGIAGERRTETAPVAGAQAEISGTPGRGAPIARIICPRRGRGRWHRLHFDWNVDAIDDADIVMIAARLQGEFGQIRGTDSTMAGYALANAAAVARQTGQCGHAYLAQGGILGVEASAGNAQLCDAVLVERAMVGQTRSAVADRAGAAVGVSITRGLIEGALSTAENVTAPLNAGSGRSVQNR